MNKEMVSLISGAQPALQWMHRGQSYWRQCVWQIQLNKLLQVYIGAQIDAFDLGAFQYQCDQILANKEKTIQYLVSISKR